jgi:hypothetical protein
VTAFVLPNKAKVLLRTVGLSYKMSLAPAANIQKDSATAAEEKEQSALPTIAQDSVHAQGETDQAQQAEGKPKKRTLFGFGKKKADDKTGNTTESSSVGFSQTSGAPTSQTDASHLSSQQSHMTSAPTMPSSPGRNVYSTSPRMGSPAGSQIFERNVQESAAVMPNSPAIPSHIQVENHIPPVLDATSEAITDNHLDPDSVEIVTHASHQPASVTVTGAGTLENPSSSWVDELASLAEKDEAMSNYGSLDSSDVRRLSFISFADVVQAEHNPHGAGGSRDSMHLAGLTSLSAAGLNRSPSPIRSPISSAGAETSPPTSNPGSVKGLDLSPSRKPVGSPSLGQHTLGVAGGNDLNIETMSQALRRTGSADLGAVRSVPTSPIEGPSR